MNTSKLTRKQLKTTGKTFRNLIFVSEMYLITVQFENEDNIQTGCK